MSRGSAIDVGRRLKAALVLRGQTAKSVGPKVGMSEATLGRIMQGKRRAKDAELEALAEAIGVPAWFLLEGLERPSKRPPATAEELVRDLDRKIDTTLTPALERIENELREASRSRRAERTPG